jgi:hypothetical protein
MKKSLFILLLTTVFFSCEKLEDIFKAPSGKDFSGYIYTSTNSTSGNAIIALGRNSDGTVKELKALLIQQVMQAMRLRGILIHNGHYGWWVIICLP